MAKEKIKILILGSSGQLGSKLVEKLIHKKNFVIIAHNRNKFNLVNYKYLEEYLKKINPDLIINCAAYTDVESAEIERKKCLEINFKTVKETVKYCVKNHITLIHFSTDYVFNGRKKKYRENAKTNPINFYGKSKELAEKYIIKNLRRYYIFRVSGLYNKKSNFKNFYNFVKTNLKKNQNLKIISNQYTIPTSVDFVTDIIKKILNKFKTKEKIMYGIYNVTPNGFTSWFNFSKKIQKKYFKNKNLISPIYLREFKSKTRRPKNSVLINNKIKKILTSKFKYWYEEI